MRAVVRVVVFGLAGLLAATFLMIVVWGSLWCWREFVLWVATCGGA